MHRPADSRLLSNLLQHEKEYTKHLLALLDTSNASLTSLAAYAAASPHPLSQVIMAVAGSLAAADDALRRYAHSVELWKETMAHLKDMEDEVGNVIRDREILVTRLIKASKAPKPGSVIMGSSVRSSSTLSLSNNQDSPSRPLSLAFSTSSKLNAAQSELQGCELHLATKERELSNSRSAALREGLGTRLKALVDCGWAWGELGKEGLRSLEALQFDSIVGDTGQIPKRTDADSFFIKASSESGISSISPSQSASQIDHDHHDPRPAIFHSSELLSAPPLAAESSTNTIRPISMATTNTVTTTGTLSGSGTSTPAHAALLAATTSTLTYAPAVAVHIPPSATSSAVGVASGTHAKENEMEIMGLSEIHLPIPPPHALGNEYVNIPLAEMVEPVNASLGEVERNYGSTPSRSSLSEPDRQSEARERQRVVRLMEKRIIGEASIVEGAGEGEYANNVQGHGLTSHELQVDEPMQEKKAIVDTVKEGGTGDGRNPKAAHNPGSSSDEALHKLEVVENPRFTSDKQREGGTEKNAEGRQGKKVPFGSPQLPHQGGTRLAASDKNAKASSSSPSKTFFGSLRGFFGSKDKSPLPTQSGSHPKSKLRTPTADSSDSDSSSNDGDWRSPTAKKRKKVLQTLLFRPPDKRTANTGTKWEPGSGGLDSWNGDAGNLRAEEPSRRNKDASEGWAAAVDAVKRAGVTATPMGRVKAGSVDGLELGGTGKRGNHNTRTRTSSDVGTSIAQSNSRLQSTRRLKKNRTVGRGNVVERSGSSGSDLDVGGSGKPTKAAFGGPPVAVSAAIAKATWVEDYPGAVPAVSSFDQREMPYVERQSPPRKCNSVDNGILGSKKEGRGIYVLIHPDDVVHGDGEESLSSPTPSSSKGQIIDLGERRAMEKESGIEEIAQKRERNDKSTSNSAALGLVVKETGKAVSRSSSLSSSRKATAILTVHSNEEGSAVPPDRKLSRDSSLRNKGWSDIGKTRRTDTLGQSSFVATGARSSTLSRPAGPSFSIPKSTSGTVGPASKTTTVTASTSANLMNIVEDVKRLREAGQITTSGSPKSGTMMEVVRAPPRSSREHLENFVGHRGAGRAGGERSENKAENALFQVQAPGSVFGHKHQTDTGSKGNSATPSPSASALGVGVQQRQGPGQVIKTPLKSALKNTSRTPSPLVRSAPLPLADPAVVPKESTMTNGITRLEAPLSITGQGLVDAENESTCGSGEEEFFTDEGEPTGESVFANGSSPITQSGTTAVRTVLVIPNEQTPRKRKSVRVSLKPTFSPSPPAIDYEENFGRRASSSHRLPKSDPHTPVPAKHKQISSHGEGNRNGNWEDSSDEDEEYKNAKAALSRAAGKDKEVSLSVFGH